MKFIISNISNYFILKFLSRDKKIKQFFIKRFGKKIWKKWEVKSNGAFAIF